MTHKRIADNSSLYLVLRCEFAYDNSFNSCLISCMHVENACTLCCYLVSHYQTKILNEKMKKEEKKKF